MTFPNLDSRPVKDLAPGVHARTFWGDQMLLAVVDLDANAVIPPHSHMHEQVGVVLQGEMEFKIGDITQTLTSGDTYVIPGGVVHSVTVGKQPGRVMDVFSPVREEYKY